MITLDKISTEEAARYMGVKGEPDERIRAIIDRADKLVRENVRPRYIYRETAVEMRPEGIWLAAVGLLLTGEDIKRHLKGCGRAIMLAATLSSEGDKLIRQAAVTDMADSLAIDCVCSAAVEQLCDKAEQEIFSVVDAPFRTWRFSPGYGDLPLELQKDFLKALDTQRRIGLTVAESGLLIPSKSVTAVIGISEMPIEHNSSGCENCSMRETCALRKR